LKAKAGSLRGKTGAYSQSGTRHKVAINGTAGYGTVRPVVWEDGEVLILTSYPIFNFPRLKNELSETQKISELKWFESDLLKLCFLLILIFMKREDDQDALLRLFEGTWLMSPSGNVAYAKVVKGQLLIPYSRSEESKLSGHYFNCHLVANRLLCRFERFEPYAAGILFLRLGPNHTLRGGWCLNENLPQEYQKDVSMICETSPKVVRCVWIRKLNAEVPDWAKEYFAKDSSRE
jgi:hypothetical protein